MDVFGGRVNLLYPGSELPLRLRDSGMKKSAGLAGKDGTTLLRDTLVTDEGLFLRVICGPYDLTGRDLAGGTRLEDAGIQALRGLYAAAEAKPSGARRSRMMGMDALAEFEEP